MTSTVSAKGSIEIPESFRMEDSIREGQLCDIERLGRGEYRLSLREDASFAPGRSWLEVLYGCPVKDWYEPVTDGETTADSNPLRFE